MLNFTGKILLVLALAAALGGCNTVRGFGEDVQHVGGAIQRGAS
ncbi:entericidin A [Leminorella richardii]|uniref:Entericidin A n=1 Tax=Leminorella richardii TaxID=158841 RepID=A0A2X4UV02_9GAMM|nr:entericidin A/B family lipoprotein [Leminorella richardii]SQI43676.1 entericidin A [Leminorella richardii]